ncbi:MAG: hypothetical protein ABI664_14880, partial [bacterium]
DVDVSWVAAVPRPLRRVDRFLGVVTKEGKSRPLHQGRSRNMVASIKGRPNPGQRHAVNGGGRT